MIRTSRETTKPKKEKLSSNRFFDIHNLWSTHIINEKSSSPCTEKPVRTGRRRVRHRTECIPHGCLSEQGQIPIKSPHLLWSSPAQLRSVLPRLGEYPDPWVGRVQTPGRETAAPTARRMRSSSARRPTSRSGCSPSSPRWTRIGAGRGVF